MYQTETVDLKITRIFEVFARPLLSLLIIAILAAIMTTKQVKIEKAAWFFTRSTADCQVITISVHAYRFYSR